MVTPVTWLLIRLGPTTVSPLAPFVCLEIIPSHRSCE